MLVKVGLGLASKSAWYLKGGGGGGKFENVSEIVNRLTDLYVFGFSQ